MSRVAESIRRSPGPLRALLLLTLIEACAWLAVMPPLQGPDEARHFSYTQKLVETHSIPWLSATPRGVHERLSDELGLALRQSGFGPLAGDLSARPPGSVVDERLFAARARGLSHHNRADVGYVQSLRYPPLYYLYAAVPYVAASGGSVFDREFWMRAAGIPLLLLVVVFTWLLAGELLGGRRWLQTVAAGVVALQPLLVHLGTVVNPDIAIAADWTAALYLMVVVLRRGPTRARVLLLAALVVAAAFLHPRALPLAIPAIAAVALSRWQRTGPHSSRARARALALAGAGALMTLIVSVAVATRGNLGGPSVRQFGSYLWQFYLPRLSFMQPAHRADWGVRQVFIDRFFGTFGQLEVTLRSSLLDVLSAAALVGLALLVAALIAKRRALAAQWRILAVLALAFVAYVFTLHVAAFSTLLIKPRGDPVLTGRYLLPLIALYGVAIATVLSWVPRRFGPALGAATLSCAVLLQFAALGAVLERFYA